MAHPERIVSLVPSLTELLVDLGLASKIIGRTRYCIHPKQALKHCSVVGGTKAIEIDLVRGLNPDWILANKEENTRESIEALSGIPSHVTEVKTLQDALDVILEVGEHTGTLSKARLLNRQLADLFESIQALRFAPLRTLYLIWRRPFMSVGQDTFIHAMLTLMGCQNVCQAQTRYPTLTENEIKHLKPGLILLSSEPYPFKVKHKAELEQLWPQARVLCVNGELFSWYGSRLIHQAQALTDLKLALHGQGVKNIFGATPG